MDHRYGGGDYPHYFDEKSSGGDYRANTIPATKVYPLWDNLRSMKNMHPSNQEKSYQEQCLSDGITCRSCVEHTARTVSSVCPGMTAAQAGQTFRAIYFHPDCLINEHDFQWAYLEADGQVNPLLSKKTGPLVQIQAA